MGRIAERRGSGLPGSSPVPAMGVAQVAEYASQAGTLPPLQVIWRKQEGGRRLPALVPWAGGAAAAIKCLTGGSEPLPNPLRDGIKRQGVGR